jgi:hypothetical protein
MSPRVKIEFYISLENNQPNEVTNRIGIFPSSTSNKGDFNPNHTVQYLVSTWKIETEYYESFDIRVQVKILLDILLNKKEILIRIKQEFQAEYKFMIVVEIPKSGGPILSFDTPFIQFASEIGSEIGIDYYF